MQLVCAKESHLQEILLIKSFVDSFLYPDEINEQLEKSFQDFMAPLNSLERVVVIRQVVNVLYQIGDKYPFLGPDVIRPLSKIIQYYSDARVLRSVIRVIVKLGRRNQALCKRLVKLLSNFADPHLSIRVLNGVITAFCLLGKTEEEKKIVMEALVSLLEHQDSDLKLRVIKAIRENLLDYKDKAVFALREMILFSYDYLLRQEALIALGDAGEKDVISIRKAVYELIKELGEQIKNLKNQLIKKEKGKHHALHIRYYSLIWVNNS